MNKPYAYQNGDQFYDTGLVAVALSPDKRDKRILAFEPMSAHSSSYNPAPNWSVTHYPGGSPFFCPQAALRGESDGDIRPGYVTDPAQLKGHAAHHIVDVISYGIDPYGQGDVFLVDDGSHLTIPSIGWKGGK